MRTPFGEVALALVLSLAGAGCGQSKADLAPIAEEDESLKKDETDLAAKRSTLQRERKRLVDERAELAEKRKTATDKVTAAALDDQELQLAKKEKELVSQESELGKKLDTLLAQRSELIQKATQVAPGGTPEERAARREQGVASREKEIAQREKEVAEREQTIALREKELAKREKETCGVASAAPAPKFELPKALKYSQHDVEPVYKKALKAMSEHGLLASDLPSGGRLVEDTRSAMQSGDYVRAKYDADRLLEEVQSVRIDRAFIQAKLARLSGAMRGKTLEGDAKALFQDATTAYGDGKFPQANQKINRLYSFLK